MEAARYTENSTLYQEGSISDKAVKGRGEVWKKTINMVSISNQQ